MSLSKVSRRRLLALIVGLGSSAATISCGGTGPERAGRRANPGAPSIQPTPTPGRILGIIPVPPPPPPTPTPTPLVIRFAHWESGAAEKLLGSLGERFGNLNPRLVVQPEVAPYGVQFARLQAELAGGSAPDVFVNSGPYVAQFVQQRWLLDLTDYLSRDQLQLSAFWTEPTTSPIEGRQFTLPIWNATEVVFFNRQHFAELKISEPPSDWTWDQFLSIARQMTRGKPGEVTRWGVLLTNDLQGGWGSFVASNGGEWL